MTEHLIIVEYPQDWLQEYPQLNVITSKEYLGEPQRYRNKGVRIINLCRSYRYLSEGYYCSLLAEARRHKIIPGVRTLADLSRKSIYSLNFDDLQQQLVRLSRGHSAEDSGDEIELLVCFGQTLDDQLQDLARMLFEMFPCPLFKVIFRNKKGWQIKHIKTVALHKLRTQKQREFFANTLQHYLTRRWRKPRQKSSASYDMAILYNPDEAMPPSNMAALRKFVKSGKRLGLDVELIQQRDYTRLGEYDALLIRETTAINHHTFRFARKAESEGLVVMDDPESIVKCTNKIYLAELLQANNVPTPRTIILRNGEDLQKLDELGLPVVLKIPDGSFSRGIYKAEHPDQIGEFSQLLFRDSDLILAQEYLYTDFDWRIGVIDGQPLFACQYFMSKAHWQIVKHQAGGVAHEGDSRTWHIHEVDLELIDLAVKAAGLIGNGFYGVDIKQTANGYVVMEVNDNPNVEAGIEDAMLGSELYDTIMQVFLHRLNKRTQKQQVLVS